MFQKGTGERTSYKTKARAIAPTCALKMLMFCDEHGIVLPQAHADAIAADLEF